MARYTIDFSTNASRIAREIGDINEALAKTTKQGKQNKIKLELDTTSLRTSIDSTFRQLDNQIAAMQRKLAGMQIGSRRFQQQATGIGIAQGMRERGGMQARAIQLGAQAEAFDIGSATRLTKQLEAARIEASQIAPNTEPWLNLQRQIGRLKVDLQAADRLAENVQMRESLGAFEPGSLNALEAKLTILRNRAREIAPRTVEWKELNKEIVNVEQSIEKQTRKPLTKGQRLGAAGGAFLYGGGLGGGLGSAGGGIAGGLIGGVPGAFTGAAIGQAVDNLGAMAFAMTEQANAVRRMRLGLASASTDLKDFAQANETVVDISNRLLIPLNDSYRQFTRLRASTIALGIDTKTTGEIFEGISVAVLKTGGSMQDVDGAMRAVSQVFSKGKVTAEELRGQLGERLPGAVVKFAQKNNIALQDLDKAFESGQVSVDQFVTFAKGLLEESAGYSDKLATNQEYASARYAKAVERMQIAIGKAVGPMLNNLQDFAAEAITEILKVMGTLEDFASFLENRFAGGKGGASSVFLGEGAGNIADRIIGGDVEVKDLEDRTKFFKTKIIEAEAQLQTIQSGRYKDKRSIFERMFGGPGEESLRKGLPNQINYYKKQLAELVKARKAAEEKMKGGVAAVTSGTSDPEAAQRAGKFLGLVEQREESIAQARKNYEQEIRSIRENAIKQAEALERRQKDQRLQDEREIGRIRRELAAAVQEEELLRRGIAGEDPALLEQERKIGDAIRQYTEDKISREEEAQDRQIAQSRELEDFKRQNADAINKANERYANAIGKIQQEYAKSVAKLIEEGSGSGAKKLAAAGKVIAAEIQKATQQQAFMAATGAAIIPRGAGKFEVAGDVFNETELIQAAEAMSKAAGTAAKAYVDATKQLEQAQKGLNAAVKTKAQAGSVSLAPVSTADLEAGVKARSDALSASLATINKEKTALSQQGVENVILGIVENIRKEAFNNTREIDRQNEALIEQVELINGGTLPSLAEEASLRERLFDQQRNQINAAIDQLSNSEEGKKLLKESAALHASILSDLIKERDVISEQEKSYANIQQALRDNAALLEAAQIQNQVGIAGQGLRAGFIGEAAGKYEEQIGKGVSPEVAAQVAKATEQLMIAKQAADALQSSIQGIGAAFGDAFTTGVASLIAGTATAKEVFTSFLQSVAQALSQAASQMIATYIAIGVAKIFAGLNQAVSSTRAIPSTGTPGALNINGVDQGMNAALAANGAYWSGGFQAFANGGMVAGPTLGLIGEGGEPEFVIPSSKMEGAMKRYNNGARGAGVIPSGRDSASPSDPGGMLAMGPIDVRYSVERINSVDYVTADQFQAGMARAAQQGALQGEQRTLRKLRNSQTVRSRMGI
jgi:tape measure domain-containing protein